MTATERRAARWNVRTVARIAVPIVVVAALSACGRAPAPGPDGGGAGGSAATPTAAGAASAPGGANANSPTGAAANSPPDAAANSPPDAAATNGATSPTGDAAARARQIRDASAQWPKVEGRWTRGARDSRYVAWFENGRLRYLEEDTSLRSGPHLVNRYWFDDAPADRALFWFDGEKPSSVPGGTGPGELPPTVAVVAEFRGAEVVRAVAREHYGEKKLDDAAVAEVRANAAALAGAAQDEWSAKQR